MPPKRVRSRSRCKAKPRRSKSPRSPRKNKCLVKRSPSQFNKTQCALTPGYHWVVGKGCVKMTDEELCCQPCEPACPPCVPPAAPAATPAAAAATPGTPPPPPNAAAPPVSSVAAPAAAPAPVAPTGAVIPSATELVELSTNTFAPQTITRAYAQEHYYWTSPPGESGGFEVLEQKYEKMTDAKLYERLNGPLQTAFQKDIIFCRNIESLSIRLQNVLYLPRYPYDFLKRELHWLLKVLIRKLRSSRSSKPAELQALLTELKNQLQLRVTEFQQLFGLPAAQEQVKKLVEGSLQPVDPPVPVTLPDSTTYRVFNPQQQSGDSLTKQQFYKLFDLKNYETGNYFVTQLKKVYKETPETFINKVVEKELFQLKLQYQSNTINRNEYLVKVKIMLQLTYARLRVPFKSEAEFKKYNVGNFMSNLFLTGWPILLSFHHKYSTPPA